MKRNKLSWILAAALSGLSLSAQTVMAESVAWDQQDQVWMSQQSAHFTISFLDGHQQNAARALDIAERVHNVERAYSCREGLERKDDRLVGKWADEPVPNGPHKGERIDSQKWEQMLDDYYQLRGWNPNGIPTKEKLTELGMDDVALSLEESEVY